MVLAMAAGGAWGSGMAGAQARDAGGPPELNFRAARHVRVTPPIPQVRGRLDTITFWAQSLGVQKRAVTWLPPAYDRDVTRRFPLAIYLHGAGQSETDWTTRGRLHLTLDSLAAAGAPPFIVVMPDGDDGWYTTWNTLGDYAACRRTFTPRPGDTADSWCVPWLHYDDYIARDVVQMASGRWRVDPRRTRRAVAGLSMGGYGAIALALSYPEVFGAAVSHSGILSPLLLTFTDQGPRYAESVDALRADWGDRWPLIAPAFGPDTAGWWARDPARMARRLRARGKPWPALYLDVGDADPLAGQSRAFHRELDRDRLAHTFAERAGAHDWDYWRRNAVHGLRFLGESFTR